MTVALPLRSITRSPIESKAEHERFDLLWNAVFGGTATLRAGGLEPMGLPARYVTIRPPYETGVLIGAGVLGFTSVCGHRVDDDESMGKVVLQVSQLPDPMFYCTYAAVPAVDRHFQAVSITEADDEMPVPGRQTETGSTKISKELVDLLGMTPGEIARMLNISERGYRNWIDGARMRLSNEKRARWLRHVAKLVESGLGPGRVREWFMTPVYRGKAPYDLIQKGRLSDVARVAAKEFETANAIPNDLTSERAKKLGFPFNVLEASDEDDLKDLARVLDK